MSKQFVISQQDTYKKKSGNLKPFLDTFISLCNAGVGRGLYIVHDQETDLHVHCIYLSYSNTTKKELLKKFPNADIEIQKGSNQQAYDYLTHKNISNKYQYDVNDIVELGFNDFELIEWLKITNDTDYVNSLGDEIEILDNITNDILSGLYKVPLDVIKNYKGVALKYMRTIKSLCFELYPNENGVGEID